jgi:hypothetical protein
VQSVERIGELALYARAHLIDERSRAFECQIEILGGMVRRDPATLATHHFRDISAIFPRRAKALAR